MLQFEPITLEHRTRMEQSYRQRDFIFRGTENCFVDLFIWQSINKLTVAFSGEKTFVRKLGGDGCPAYLFPAGAAIAKADIALLAEDAEKHRSKLRFIGLPEEAKASLESLYPGRFDYSEQRDRFDYIYTVEALSALQGKKLHAKRNFVNRFSKMYAGRWRYDPYTQNDFNEVYDFHRYWCRMNNCQDDPDLADEACAVAIAIKNFDNLNMSGGVLRLDGHVIAFTMGAPLGEDTFCVQIEKADNIPGAYPMINREFVLANCQRYTYVNREEDMGMEGLRKAKLSYHPEFLVAKYEAVER